MDRNQQMLLFSKECTTLQMLVTSVEAGRSVWGEQGRVSLGRLSLGWQVNMGSKFSGWMALLGLGNQLLLRHLLKWHLQMENLGPASFVHETLRVGVTFKQSSPRLHFNLPTNTPYSESSYSKFWRPTQGLGRKLFISRWRRWLLAHWRLPTFRPSLSLMP